MHKCVVLFDVPFWIFGYLQAWCWHRSSSRIKRTSIYVSRRHYILTESYLCDLLTGIYLNSRLRLGPGYHSSQTMISVVNRRFIRTITISLSLALFQNITRVQWSKKTVNWYREWKRLSEGYSNQKTVKAYKRIVMMCVYHTVFHEV